MAGNTSPGGQASDSRASAVRSLAESEIRKALRMDALQQPTTILPLALCILSIIYVLLLSPVLGGAVAAIVLLIVGAVLATASFFWRYSIRFNAEYARKAQELVEILEQEGIESGEGELSRMRETLETGFTNLKTNEGLKALSQLNEVYHRLQPVIESKRATDPMAVAHIPTLAEETYKQGLSVLADSLGLMTAIHSPTNERLEREMVEIKKQLEDESQPERVTMLEERLASHQERLDLVNQQQLRVDQLLCQSESCEASLHRTRIEVAALKADGGESSVRAVTDTLRKTINQAKEVQEELKKLGY